MTPEQQAQMDTHVSAIAGLLHTDAQEKDMPMGTLGEIEQTVRQQLQAHVSPSIGSFLSKQIVQKIASHPDASSV